MVKGDTNVDHADLIITHYIHGSNYYTHYMQNPYVYKKIMCQLKRFKYF